MEESTATVMHRLSVCAAVTVAAFFQEEGTGVLTVVNGVA